MARRRASKNSDKRNVSPTGALGQRIRERRKELGLSLHDLADRAGLTASFLSLIERDQSSPSLESLRRVAEALEVPLFHFVSEVNGQNPVVRHDARTRITFPPGDVTYELIVPNLRNRLEVFIGRAHPSAGNIARTPKHASEECIFLMDGRLKVTLSDGEYTLEKGDSIYFHGSTLREISAQGSREAVFLSIITPPVL